MDHAWNQYKTLPFDVPLIGLVGLLADSADLSVGDFHANRRYRIGPGSVNHAHVPNYQAHAVSLAKQFLLAFGCHVKQTLTSVLWEIKRPPVLASTSDFVCAELLPMLPFAEPSI